MLKGHLKLLDKDKGLMKFTYGSKYYPKEMEFSINGIDDILYKWFWTGDTVTACFTEKNEGIPNLLGWNCQITIPLSNGQKLTVLNKYEYLRYKGKPTSIIGSIEHVLCV